MTSFAYLDVESWPNFFQVGIKMEGYVVSYELSERKDEMQALANDLFCLIDDTTLVTYNGYKYDIPMLNYLFAPNRPNPPKPDELKWFGSSLIEGENKSWIYNKYCLFQHRHIDLMRAFGTNDRKRISLKAVGIHLKYKNLVTLPYPHDVNLTHAQMDNVIAYNEHDLNITQLLHEKQTERYTMTRGVSQQFEVDVLQANDTEIGKSIFKRKLEAENYTHFDLNTQRDTVALKDCLPDLQFDMPVLADLYRKLKRQVLDIRANEKIKEQIVIGDIAYDLGVGGLHGYDKTKRNLYYESNENFTITDGDVTSYYPCLQIEHNIYPEHIGPVLLPVIKNIFEERKESKKLRYEDDFHKTREYALKIAMNSAFGLLGERHSFLYDPKAFFSVTMHGQLFLLKWVEMLHRAGIKIISANTDGITVWLNKNQEQTYKQIAADWMGLTRLDLEFETFKRLAMRDVNNYAGLLENGDIKDKGSFLLKKRLNQSPSSAIINRAAVKNLMYSKPIEETIGDCNDIHDYIITKRNGDDWVLHVDGKPQQETNRYYASINGSYFFSHEVLPQAAKTKTLFGEAQQQGRTRAEIKGQLLTLANDISGHEDCSNVDKNYYIAETYKLVNGFILGGETSKQQNEKPQQSHFGFY